ncbi:MAG: SRPBCC family protein [Jatrophihabitantaceae bacterium]
MTEHEAVTASRRIGAAAADIFRVLADPARHQDLDGSGMLRGAVSEGPVTGIGDVFTMKMHYSEHGDYQMDNHVVVYEPDRRIGWEPEAGLGHPDQDAPDARWGHRWIFELQPDGPDATVVTETYDCSRAPEQEQAAMNGGRMWIEAMSRTLQRLDEACTSPGSGSP